MRTLLVSLVAAATVVTPSAAQRAAPRCAPDNAGLTLPTGFCALVVADSAGPVRHLTVAPNGDILVAVRGRRPAQGQPPTGGGVLVLRDTTGDGVADVRRRFGPDSGGSGIALSGGYLYFSPDNAVIRWRWTTGALEPAGAAETVVSGLTSRGQHAAKTIAIGGDGGLYVNIGAPSNACQEVDRTAGSKGQDPCPLLDIAGGIWRFNTNRTGQTQADGERFATGLRNVVAIGVDPAGTVYGAQHGRDQLALNWPALYNEQQSADKPAEELFRLERGGDYGWPYCYYDLEASKKVLGPEYGGDGQATGRCSSARNPEVAFPGHWAPNGIVFYTGTQFPASYRGGVFIAFHGSWNRAPLPQGGYNVTFVPFAGGKAAGPYTVFADGFAGADRTPQGAAHRPTGLAVGPDGSLYLSDDKGGTIYRILYRP